jgi:NADPH-dependent curcumin reductase CurA
VDKVLNYKSKTFYEDWKALGYFDVYFDNVGGVSWPISDPYAHCSILSQEILDFALTRMNRGARIVFCGE